MVKLIALYRHPEDKKAFDDHYWNVHAPLAEKMPGLKKLEVTRLVGTPMTAGPWTRRCPPPRARRRPRI